MATIKSSGRAITRRRFLLGSSLAALSLTLYANEISRHEIDLIQRTFLIRNLPPAFHGFRIVQISDIHLDEFTEDFFLKEIIARINTLTPDLILITGDFCSRGPLPERYSLPAARRCAELLSTLHCPQRYGILGNHDAVVGPLPIRDYMANNGIPILVNQYIPLERGADRIWLAGVDDTLNGTPILELAIPYPILAGKGADHTPVILLAHEPDYVQRVVAHPLASRIDLVLSGHTHGGQIRLPGIGPVLLPPGGEHFPHGHYALGNLQLYVNRGIGTVGVPLRLNCPPEITLATLQPALA
jgi:predicted MPP superfamily phosphohydrolase